MIADNPDVATVVDMYASFRAETLRQRSYEEKRVALDPRNQRLLFRLGQPADPSS